MHINGKVLKRKVLTLVVDDIEHLIYLVIFSIFNLLISENLSLKTDIAMVGLDLVIWLDLKVGLDNLRGLCQPKWFYDSVCNWKL